MEDLITSKKKTASTNTTNGFYGSLFPFISSLPTSSVTTTTPNNPLTMSPELLLNQTTQLLRNLLTLEVSGIVLILSYSERKYLSRKKSIVFQLKITNLVLFDIFVLIFCFLGYKGFRRWRTWRCLCTISRPSTTRIGYRTRGVVSICLRRRLPFTGLCWPARCARLTLTKLTFSSYPFTSLATSAPSMAFPRLATRARSSRPQSTSSPRSTLSGTGAGAPTMFSSPRMISARASTRWYVRLLFFSPNSFARWFRRMTCFCLVLRRRTWRWLMACRKLWETRSCCRRLALCTTTHVRRLSTWWFRRTFRRKVSRTLWITLRWTDGEIFGFSSEGRWNFIPRTLVEDFTASKNYLYFFN